MSKKDGSGHSENKKLKSKAQEDNLFYSVFNQMCFQKTIIKS